MFVLLVIAYRNSASKFNVDLGFSISEKEILRVHTQTSPVPFEKEKKAQTLLQNTVYSMFQAVLCVCYTMQATAGTWVIHIQLPANSPVPYASAHTEAPQKC